MTTTPIGDLALLSDRHSAALVDRGGGVQWLAFPRFDSASVVGGLLGAEAGLWRIGATSSEIAVERRYLDGTLVLETTFRTPTGVAVLTEAMATGEDADPHALGRAAAHLLVRRVECRVGSVEIAVRFAPRPEYGLVVPLIETIAGGLRVRGGADRLALTSPWDLSTDTGEARATRTLSAGQSATFALHHGRLGQGDPRTWSQEELGALLDGTLRAWRAWSAIHQTYQGPWRDLVHTSGRVLQALSFQPTGAIIAAATTSLPEGIGGERNWDYRYAWVRDSCFTMQALWVAACPDEAVDFFSFMTGAAATVDDDNGLQIMFGVGGEHDLTERTLPHLEGWRDSRPVRVGNGAWNQQQVDIYGELLGAAHQLRDYLDDIDDATRRFLVACADAAATRWRERDQGIWEVRGEPRDFVYSKVMCWVALDRAIALGQLLRAEDRVDAWKRTRDEIHAAVLEHGWSERAGAFAQSFGSDDLDASTLMMPIVGFLPATDPRMTATIDAIADRLTDDRGLVYRYRTEGGVDGLNGDEGTFLLCTFWLAEALALAGRSDRARQVFEAAIAYRNDLGLLAEEVDADTGELLGNFPQAFSHIGLVNAAWAISQAR
ncbi:MAG TPA: glycoside hydrolase family 15 protein [Kineosporiaceae bacterium]|nr:glycoside hydrolase family 15 protein [Kineosporiaceae bacterium]